MQQMNMMLAGIIARLWNVNLRVQPQSETYHSPYQAHSRQSDLLSCLSTQGSKETMLEVEATEVNPNATRTDSRRNWLDFEFVIFVLVFLVVSIQSSSSAVTDGEETISFRLFLQLV